MSHGHDLAISAARWSPGSSRSRLIAMVAFATVLLGFAAIWQAGPYSTGGHEWGAREHHSDFTAYLAAGRAVSSGTDIYHARNRRGWPYVYPAALAIAVVPLTRLPLPLAVLLWYLISLASIICATRWCAQLAGAKILDPEKTSVLLPIALSLAFLVNGLARGQASIVVSSLVFGAFYFDSRERPLRAAACFAGAVLLKVFPVVLLGYFIWRGRWRFCLATLLFIGLGGVVFPASVFGWQQSLAYLSEWAHLLAPSGLTSGPANPYHEVLLQWSGSHNQALYAVLGRLTSRFDGSLVPWVRTLWTGMAVAMLLPIYLIGRTASRDREIFIISALIVWLLLAMPMSELHYYTLLLLPFFVLTHKTAGSSHGTRRLARSLITIFAVFGLMVAVLGPTTKVFWVYGWLCWLCVLLWAGLLVLAVRRAGDVASAKPARPCFSRRACSHGLAKRPLSHRTKNIFCIIH